MTTNDARRKIPTLISYNEQTLRSVAEDAATLCSIKNGEPQKKTFSAAVLNQILGDQNLNIPTIKGLILNPYIDDLGQRVNDPGDHRQLLGIFSSVSFTRKNPKEALIFINEAVLSEFRFEGETDGPDLKNVNRLAAIAAIMTAVQRKMLEIAPMVLILAPEFKAGKSVLTDVVTTTAAGSPVAKTHIPLTSSTRNDNPETGKRLETLLVKNPPAIAIDNIPDGGEAQSTVLTALLTSPVHEFRLLGVHESIAVQTNVLFIGNGRNISISDQLASRTLIVNLAEGKSKYQRNAVKDAMENRDQIVSAVLDIIEAGLATETSIRGTRFKQWDRFIAAPLALASGVDITEQFAKTEDASEERNYNRLILQGLFKYDKPIKAEELAGAFNDVEERLFTVKYEDGERWDQLFHEGLGGLLDRREDRKLLINSRAVGRLLKPLLNRALEIEDTHGNIVKVSLTQNGRRYYRVEVKKT